MALIDRKFLVDFEKPAFFVVYLLPKTKRIFLSVNFLQIAGAPTAMPSNVNPISSAAAG